MENNLLNESFRNMLFDEKDHLFEIFVDINQDSNIIL